MEKPRWSTGKPRSTGTPGSTSKPGSMSKAWSSTRLERDPQADAAHPPTRRKSPAGKNGQDLARAAADVSEAERRIARQIVVIGELEERGDPTAEPVKALARLETQMLASRDRHEQLLTRLSAADTSEQPAEEPAQGIVQGIVQETVT